jgi:hypothetical protein
MVDPVPQISAFYGIVIRLYWSDHQPPHFHAIYAEHEALVEIATGELIRGTLPARAMRLVREWQSLHGQELAEDWKRAQTQAPLLPIEPLP